MNLSRRADQRRSFPISSPSLSTFLSSRPTSAYRYPTSPSPLLRMAFSFLDYLTSLILIILDSGLPTKLTRGSFNLASRPQKKGEGCTVRREESRRGATQGSVRQIQHKGHRRDRSCDIARPCAPPSCIQFRWLCMRAHCDAQCLERLDIGNSTWFDYIAYNVRVGGKREASMLLTEAVSRISLFYRTCNMSRNRMASLWTALYFTLSFPQRKSSVTNSLVER